MEITPTSEFIHRNRIKQGELAKYLGVTDATISRYVNGSLEIPVKNVTQIINNPYGWDTSMFTSMNNTTITTKASGNGKASVTIGSNNNCNNADASSELKALQKEIEILRQQLEEEKKRSERYWEMIQKLLNK